VKSSHEPLKSLNSCVLLIASAAAAIVTKIVAVVVDISLSEAFQNPYFALKKHYFFGGGAAEFEISSPL